MRLSVLPATVVLSFGVIACDGEPLTGPAAQAAYVHATSRYATVPGHAVVIIDGQRMPAGQRPDDFDPNTIVRIEIIKGEAAARLYGDGGRAGVIRVYTTRGVPPTTPGQP